MSLKETIFSMMIEALDEAVEVSHDRYMRSHGKKARDSGGGSGNWMFTHKSMGDVDYKNDKEVHNARGKFADAKKSAQAWAKEHGHRTVYVMESVEQIDEISDEKKKEYIRAVADKGGILRKPRPGSLKGFDRKKDDALVKAFKGGSMQDYANLHKKSEKRAGIALNTLNSLKKEEVELDEAEKPNQYIEVINKFTGSKSHHEVHPTKAFAALNRHNSLWNTKSARIVSGKEAEDIKASKMKKEEVELDEETMPGNIALRLVDSHQAAAFHHKKNGNMKGYAAHFKVAERIEDAVIRAGRDMPVKSKQLEAASDKAFRDHPHRVVKN